MKKSQADIFVVEAKLAGGYVLDLGFSDGKRVRVDLEDVLWGRMFEPLRDPARFAQVTVDRELGTIVWQNGADLAPEFLYERCRPVRASKGKRD